MHAKTLYLAGLLASVASAHVIRNEERRSCAAPEPTAEDIAAGIELDEMIRNGSMPRRAALTIPTVFHVVSPRAGGGPSDSQLAQQLAVMNEDYAEADISFELIDTTRTVNSAWAQDSGEAAMKRQLRQGDYGTLNVYFQDRLTQNALGYCYFPSAAASNPGSSGFNLDGCSVLSSSVPGGSAPFDLGRTATHEIGHWLQLYHVFQGSSCTGPGDQVDDTFPQLTPSYGCPVGKNTCPNQPGMDNIHNFMDYADDACMEEFTPGQVARMHAAYSNFRA